VKYQIYDYGIIGAGLAGLQLALAFTQEPFFKDKNILLIDQSPKNQNDKTWCFWEKGKGQWENIISHRWQHGQFISKHQHLQFDLSPYQYKKIESLHFYTFAKQTIDAQVNIDFILNEVQHTKQRQDYITIKTASKKYLVKHCFDSRIDPAFYKDNSKHIKLWQPFKGWFVKFTQPVFDTSVFTMMDYRIQHQNKTSFTYILPFSPTEALIEYTLFSPSKEQDLDYDYYLKKYIKTYVSQHDFEITAFEQGIIPMTTYPFHKVNNQQITKIGTGGGWVRPSTGYSFKYTEKFVQKVVCNIKNGKMPGFHLHSLKTQFYDTLLLDILYRKNHLGPVIFEHMYQNNAIQHNFAFLDGENTLLNDFRLFKTLPIQHFLQAISRQHFKLISKLR